MKKIVYQWFLMWNYTILGVLALFITATIRKLTGSFVVFLAAARFSGKCDRKGGVAHTKVGVVNKNFRTLRAHNKKNPPFQYPTSAPGMVRSIENRFLNNPANVSLLVNTDGVSIFRSSKCSLWPIWLVINELPPSQRYAQIHYHNYGG